MRFRGVSARHDKALSLRAARQHPSLESLEPRLLLDAVYPSANDQYMLELINRGRADPQAEVDRYSGNASDIEKYWTPGVTPGLNEGLKPGTVITPDPKQPLAFNLNIIDAATKHSDWMLRENTFTHYEGDPGNPLGDPDDPFYDAGDRMFEAGYVFTGSWGWGENIAWRGTTGTLPVMEFVYDIEGLLFGDASVNWRGHRVTLMNDAYREIGIGVRIGEFTSGTNTYNTVMVTEDFALSGSDRFVTGVAYEDQDLDGFYTPGEGEQGVSVEAFRPSDGATFTTATWASGGYSLPVPPGTYNVTLTWPGEGAKVFSNVVITDSNVKLDAILLPRVDAPDLEPASDTGVAGDNITNLDNDGSTRKLTFDVGGTSVGATVTVYVGGVPFGSATATGSTTAVTTDGLTDLADGANVITAKQSCPHGLEPTASDPLAITVDTVAPTLDKWYSAGAHGATEQLLEIADASFSEPRDAGIETLVLDFSEDVNLADAVAVFVGHGPGGAVSLDHVTARVSNRAADQGEIAFDVALPDFARYIVRLDKAEDIAGNALAAGGQHVMTALAGDVDGDLDTDVYDMRQGWNHRAKAAAAGPGETRADANGDGIVTAADVLLAWARRGHDASGLADPTPPAPAAAQSASQGTPVNLDAYVASPAPELAMVATAQPPSARGQAASVTPTAHASASAAISATSATQELESPNLGATWDIPVAADPLITFAPSYPPEPTAELESSMDTDLADILGPRLDPLTAED